MLKSTAFKMTHVMLKFFQLNHIIRRWDLSIKSIPKPNVESMRSSIRNIMLKCAKVKLMPNVFTAIQKHRRELTDTIKYVDICAASEVI